MSENEKILGDHPIEGGEPTEEQEKPEYPKRRLALFGGLGIVAVLGAFALLLTAIVVFDPFGLVARIFGGGDPIAAMAPADVPLYMSFDLLQTQSEEVDELFSVFRELTEEEGEVNSLFEILDEGMEEDYGMTVSEDILPWIGQYAGMIFTNIEIDLYGGMEELDFAAILEVSDKDAADTFLVKITAALEKNEGIKFEMREEAGARFYVYTAESDFESDLVISRVDKYFFMASSVESILTAVNMDKADSLEESKSFIEAVDYLPSNRMMTLFMNGEAYFDMLSGMTLDSSTTAVMDQLGGIGMGSVGVSLSAEEAGFRMDSVSVFDPESFNDDQKAIIAADYAQPTTDSMVPEDTFLYMGANSPSANLSEVFSEDSPLFTEDYQEALELLEAQSGVDIIELFKLMSGEIAIAFAPADDGLLAEVMNVNFGFTILVGTENEAGFDAWMEPLITPLLADPTMSLEDFQVGDGYELHALNTNDNFAGKSITSLIYGADNGFIVIGTSPGMLEDGFGAGPSLADNPLYQETWEAFPAGSIPYFYLDIRGLMSFITDTLGEFSGTDYQEQTEVFTPMTVLAGVNGKPSDTVQTSTIILFIDKSASGE